MILQGDVLISELIRQGLDDLRKNIWLLDDVFSSFVQVEAFREKYGQKEIDRAKEWFANNKIDVYMRYRNDKDEMPCVTVALGGSDEIVDMKSLGDLSPEIETLIPSKIGKPIPYMVKPFVPASYDSNTNIVVAPDSTSLRRATPGMLLVDTETGNGYVISQVYDQSITIIPGTEPFEAQRVAVAPKYPFYRVRREHTFFSENYQIGCHVHGDPSTLLWLHSIVLYLILRYRESMLEGRGFAQSSVSSTDLMPNSAMSQPGGETVFSRFISLNGQVENSWLKLPERVIETAELGKTDASGFKYGIKILSNLDGDGGEGDEQLWTTSDGEE